jgi:hypothetical protein
VFAVLIAALTVRFMLEPPAGQVKSLPTVTAASWNRYGSVPVNTKTLSMINNPNADPDDVFTNFNDGRSPFGLKANAEIWNGRIAMVSTAVGSAGLACDERFSMIWNAHVAFPMALERSFRLYGLLFRNLSWEKASLRPSKRMTRPHCLRWERNWWPL